MNARACLEKYKDYEKQSLQFPDVALSTQYAPKCVTDSEYGKAHLTKLERLQTKHFSTESANNCFFFKYDVTYPAATDGSGHLTGQLAKTQ